eukprot:464037-Rhodomonas_salina.2
MCEREAAAGARLTWRKGGCEWDGQGNAAPELQLQVMAMMEARGETRHRKEVCTYQLDGGEIEREVADHVSHPEPGHEGVGAPGEGRPALGEVLAERQRRGEAEGEGEEEQREERLPARPARRRRGR